MSRVAKAPVNIPASVQFELSSDLLTLKGPKGSLEHYVNKEVAITVSEDKQKFYFQPANKSVSGWAQSGTLRAIVNNMVKGVTEGFQITLELVGVGYRAQAAGSILNLSLGYSHPIKYELPEGIQAETPIPTQIILKGINKQLLGQVASEVRAFRPPEPYKGKGVKYSDEVIQRKEAKKK